MLRQYENDINDIVDLRGVLEETGLRRLAFENAKDPPSVSQVMESLDREAGIISDAIKRGDAQ